MLRMDEIAALAAEQAKVGGSRPQTRTGPVGHFTNLFSVILFENYYLFIVLCHILLSDCWGLKCCIVID